ncbi:hypothetical protein BSPA14S_K0002 (plasmid) [Borreliella spielmanii A14S]|uniref:Uncharacterized protein n=1 Tax=Borreliella spielmanii A14S TaxID=498742 RepID=C0RBR2_9SPIR|nr:hypothetical protein BSPA14S_K0002 [Borreliella spielmanii A14S]
MESSFISIFDNYFMLLDFRSLQMSGNNGELGGVDLLLLVVMVRF